MDVARNLDRLALSADVRTADCSAPESWWDGVPFDRILADVPCSASGVVRRHPDIKWLRRGADIPAFAARQARILDALWRMLAPGGKLLYVTCSVFPEENGSVVDAFLARTPGALRAVLPDGAAGQLLPDAEHDGFYFSLLAKPA
jgi:16S rRNA (cytosine967-C5)-methyltransferase